MLDKTNELTLPQRLTQALVLLEKNKLGAFLEEMATLGEWLQKNHHLPCYKGHEQVLKAKMAVLRPQIAATLTRNPQQALAFEALQLAWHDSSLARTKTISFTEDATAPSPPNSCQIVWLKEEPFWLLVPVNAAGVKQPPLDPRTTEGLDDVAELLQKKRNGLEIDLDRLKRALKRANIETLDQRNLSAKADLGKASRHRIKLGLEAFKLLCPESGKAAKEEALSHLVLAREPTAEEIARFPANTYLVIRPQKGQKGRVWFFKEKGKKQEIKNGKLENLLDGNQLRFLSDLSLLPQVMASFNEKIRLLLLDEHFRRIDEAAVLAIRRYKTTRQKVMRVFENTVAALAAFSYGGVSLVATLLGLIGVLGIVWTNPGLAIVGGLLVAGAVIFPGPSVWTNWKVFSSYLSNFFGKIGTEYREINSPKKKALFWGLAVLAMATGIASAGLAYTATIALPALLGLGAIGFVFPPLGMAIAAAIAISQAVTFIRSFCDILRKENSWKSFKKPFADVAKLLRGSNASFGRRFATWLMVGGLSLLAALGLVMSCFTATRSVGKLFIDQFMLAPQKALYFGIAISAVSAFLSRIYFTLKSAFSFARLLSQRLFKANPRKFFSKDPNHYQIKIIEQDLDPTKPAEQVLRPGQYRPEDKVIILTGTKKGEKAAYFVQNQKLANTEKGILRVPVQIAPREEKLLANKEKQDEQASSRRQWFVQKILTRATDEMLAQENRLHPIPRRKVAAVVTESTLSGTFYLWSILDFSQRSPDSFEKDIDLHISGMSPGPAAVLATGALLASTTRALSINATHAAQPKDPDEEKRTRIAEHRIRKAQQYYREKNPHCVFGRTEEKLEPGPYEAISSVSLTRT